MTILSRKRIGYAPGLMDGVYLAQDINELEGRWHSQAHSLSDLLADSEELEAEARRLNTPELIGQVLLQQGQILLAHGVYRHALLALNKADAVFGTLFEQDWKVKVLAGLAEAYAGLGEWLAVLGVTRPGIELVEKYRYHVNSQYLQSSYLRARIGLYTHGIRAAYELGQYELALTWAELSKCRSVLRPKSLNGATASQTKRDFRRVCRQIDEAKAIGDEDELPFLLTKRRTLWDLLLIQQAQQADLALPVFDLAKVQATLAPDEAILYYYWLDKQQLLVATISSTAFDLMLHQVTDEERTQLETFAQVIFNKFGYPNKGYLTFLDEVEWLNGVLFPAGIHTHLAHKKRLIISPHRLLHTIPFQLLPWDEQNPYLIQRFALSYTPNLSNLLTQYTPCAEHSLLAIGIKDGEIPGHHFKKLPFAEVETETLESLYKQKGLTARSWLNVKKDPLREQAQAGQLASYSVCNIATHGKDVNSDTPMESFLYLQDGLLDGLEIVDWQMGAELVVLSACSAGQRAVSGRGLDELPGDDLFGLQAAFFAAGTKRLVGTLWPVYSKASSQIVVAFHKALLAGELPDVALQQALVQYLANAGLKLSKSYYWASFFLSAVGRPE